MKKWWLFEKQEEPDRTDYSALQAAIFTLIVIVICVAIRAVTWPGDKHVDISFIGQAVFIPMMCALGLFFFLMISASAERLYTESQWEIAKTQENALKTYASNSLTLAGWALLTPLEEPALNMLKLEGEFPLAPKTPLNIPRDDVFEFTPNEQLLAPLTEKLKTSHYKSFESALWVRGGDESCCDDLRRTFQRLGLTSNNIEYLTECPGYSLINDWIDKARGYVFNQLLIIVDVHDEEGDSKTMENATALLLTNDYWKTEAEKPVYLFRPISGITDVEETLPVYLQVKPVNAPKTLWYTGLSKVEKYPLMQGLDEAKLVANRLELETSFGDKSAGYRWLALALAAEAVKYAQGDQLIAASDSNRLDITPMSSCLPALSTESLYVEYTRPWQYGGYAGLMIAFAALFGISMFNDAGPTGELSHGMALFMVIAIIVIFLSIGIFTTVHTENKAYEQMKRPQRYPLRPL